MKLTLHGREYSCDMFSLLDLSMGEAREIKRHTGMSLSEWRLGLMTLQREDPDVLAGIVAVLKRRAGETADWAELDTLSSQELVKAFTFDDEAAETAEPAAEEKPAPKKAPAKRSTKPASK